MEVFRGSSVSAAGSINVNMTCVFLFAGRDPFQLNHGLSNYVIFVFIYLSASTEMSTRRIYDVRKLCPVSS